MKTVRLTCSGCNIDFKKPKKEYDRQIRKGRTEFYCNSYCYGVNKAGKQLQTTKIVDWRKSDENKLNLSSMRRAKIKKEINPFIKYIKVINNRKHIDVDIDLLYIQELWKNQGGQCAYTGIDMSHPNWGTRSNPFTTASLDRIDSSIGYVRGNIQFILRSLNWAKNTASDKEFREFLLLITDKLQKSFGKSDKEV